MQASFPSPAQIFTRVVYMLIAINIIVFGIDNFLGNGLLDSLALYFPKNEHYGVWQYVSHMFMHGGIAHLLFNMYALWMFGTALEGVLGKSRFLIYYFACGIGAGVIYTLVNNFQFNDVYNLLKDSGLLNSDIIAMLQKNSYPPSVLSAEQAREILSIYHVPMVGASGAIYGILVAFAIFFPNNKLMIIFIPYPVAAKFFVPALIALDLFSGVTGFSLFGGGVAHFAHVGGALIGFLLLFIWRDEFTKKKSLYTD